MKYLEIYYCLFDFEIEKFVTFAAFNALKLLKDSEYVKKTIENLLELQRENFIKKTSDTITV